VVGVLGFLLGSVTVTLLQALLPTDARESYGWRIPFLRAGPLGLAGLYIRLRLDDTPQFAELSKTKQVAKSPLREAVSTAWRPILHVIGLMIIFNIGYCVVFTFLPTYFIKTLHFTKTEASVSITLASPVALILVLPLAALSDRSGRRSRRTVRHPDALQRLLHRLQHLRRRVRRHHALCGHLAHRTDGRQ
jgi:MHS family proline/betaine transporter-like MFS transporter